MKDAPINKSLLADALVDVVDDIRRSIHGALGTRVWEVSIVTRRWSGDTRGVGTPTVSIVTLDPDPKVERVSRDRMGPAGREAAGSVVLTGVSLRYTEAELQGSPDERTEVAYRLREKHGQRKDDRWYVLAASPRTRRGDSPGDCTDWYIILTETSAMGDDDGVDAP